MTIPHLSQPRELQDENARLKRTYADLALMRNAWKDVVDPKRCPQNVARWLCNRLVANHGYGYQGFAHSYPKTLVTDRGFCFRCGVRLTA